ncbi:peptidoglycan DD-metalloendopeptidase family protein [Salinimicrobium flavum]|uniref:Peptidoglycan DD-metalloendopeptidase family protein n=1 Tax=Salinimicrobium flavum TaxID=1737065 RepID=A0ABW5IZ60_9FLAO
MQENEFLDFIAGLTEGFTPVVDAGFSVKEYIPVDLSAENKELTPTALSTPEGLSKYLDGFLSRTGMKIAWGGYNEKRGLYRRSSLFSEAIDEDLVRDVHLGMDIWAPAGTPVLAVLDGRIHSFRDNDNFGDYGPTIILEHNFEERKFYTLYGHLSRASLQELKVGVRVNRGQQIAVLGSPLENGEYAPHLHFQIIKDPGNRIGDYPGVACRKELSHYLQNCPDPNLLLKIPFSI